jgi:hypothetical protein
MGNSSFVLMIHAIKRDFAKAKWILWKGNAQ